MQNAIMAGADAFNRWFEVPSVLWGRNNYFADIGHFESERYTKNYIVDYLRKKSLILQSFYQKKIQIQLSTYRIWRIRKN
jgi:hypothetical protein